VPELPEVETVRSQIAPFLEGRTFERVEILDPRLTRPNDPAQVAAELEGEQVLGVERRGKYVVLRFESGRVLLIHLRMTGNLLLGAESTGEVDPYRRAVISLDDGSEVVYRDVRRFGTWLLLEPAEEEPYLAARVGEEPLLQRFTAAALARRLAGRRAPLKAALLDQRTVAGLGNIYADEALWRARLHPLRPAGSLDPAEIRALHRSIRRALDVGIRRQGATLRDYRTPAGTRGAMQDEFKVYGRAGEPCSRCGATIAKTRAGGRGTWFCPGCQV
jgi:formamidopyrimidine-DNA glycosylase